MLWNNAKLQRIPKIGQIQNGREETMKNGKKKTKRGVGMKFAKMSVCGRTLIDSHFKNISVELNYCIDMNYCHIFCMESRYLSCSLYLLLSPGLSHSLCLHCERIIMPLHQSKFEAIVRTLHTDRISNVFTKQTDRIGETKTVQNSPFYRRCVC